MTDDPFPLPGQPAGEGHRGSRSVVELRGLRVVAQMLDPHELSADTAEHILASLLDPGTLEVLEHELDVTAIVVDLRAGVGSIEDLISPERVAVEVPELTALLREYLIAQGRDPRAARRRAPSDPGRRWISPPGGSPTAEPDPG